MTTHDTPRVYIACLACYNEGTHHGEWINANDADDMQQLIDRLQGNLCHNCLEPRQDHEESGKCAHSPTDFRMHPDGCGHVDNDWAIHDQEGFFSLNIGENPSLSDLAGLAKNIEEHGEAFALYVSHVGADWNDTDGFQDAYQGEYNNEEDFAYQLAEELGAVTGNESWPLNCIDWERAARDLFCGDHWFESGYVFRSI